MYIICSRHKLYNKFEADYFILSTIVTDQKELQKINKAKTPTSGIDTSSYYIRIDIHVDTDIYMCVRERERERNKYMYRYWRKF